MLNLKLINFLLPTRKLDFIRRINRENYIISKNFKKLVGKTLINVNSLFLITEKFYNHFILITILTLVINDKSYEI